MAISESFNGSAAIGTTEYDLPSDSTTVSAQATDGIYQLFLDLSELTVTESYQLRIYEMVQSGGTQRVIDETVISGVQTNEPIYVTAALLLIHGWTYTLTKLQGTDRDIAWSIRQVA
jgi:hypothetical protein